MFDSLQMCPSNISYFYQIYRKLLVELLTSPLYIPHTIRENLYMHFLYVVFQNTSRTCENQMSTVNPTEENGHEFVTCSERLPYRFISRHNEIFVNSAIFAIDEGVNKLYLHYLKKKSPRFLLKHLSRPPTRHVIICLRV